MIVAKRYVKALMETFGDEDLQKLANSLVNISALYKIEKFITILQSPSVSREVKLEFVLEMLDKNDIKMVNFMKILNQHDRLLLIPSITKELQANLAKAKNIYVGEVVSDWDLSAEQIKSLEESFGKKFGSSIKLEAKKSDYPGIKIAVDGLGIEASFSVERLKAQMCEHILKAI